MERSARGGRLMAIGTQWLPEFFDFLMISFDRLIDKVPRAAGLVVFDTLKSYKKK